MMNFRDATRLRKGLLSINPDVSHRATQPPAPSEIYTPSHHVSALDPDNSLVVGIRGVGKSFGQARLETEQHVLLQLRLIQRLVSINM